MRFLRESRREYFRLRAMLFNAPGAQTRCRDAAPSASTLPLSNLKSEISEISNSQVPPPAGPPSCTAASAVFASEPPSDRIDKIGELADFSENQPRSTNDLQQPKSSPADFPPATTPDSVTPDVRRGLTSSEAPANPEPSSAYAAQAEQPTPTAQPIQHLSAVPPLCGPKSHPNPTPFTHALHTTHPVDANLLPMSETPKSIHCHRREHSPHDSVKPTML
jgi:hypothetical protein